MAIKYLIDVNLPYFFSLWNTHEFIHQRDISDEWNDKQIWQYAIENNLTIISKDSDFSNRVLMHTPPPKVIHIRFGNMKMKEFFEIMTRIWPEINMLNKTNKLVNVYKDRIEVIS